MEKLYILHPTNSKAVHNSVRVVVDGIKVYFSAVDIAAALGFGNPRNAVCRYCPDNTVLIRFVDANKRNQYTKFLDYDAVRDFINESHRVGNEAVWDWINDRAYPVLESKTGLTLQRGREDFEDDLLGDIIEMTETMERLCQELEGTPKCCMPCCG